MPDAIVVLNAGSSSLKAAAFDVEAHATAPASRYRIDDLCGTQADHDRALEVVLDRLRTDLRDRRIVAFGHRVVHGGDRGKPGLIDAATLAALEALVPLAPLHQPHNLAPIARLRATHPGVPQVACFDTAFHRTNPDVAQRFALPGALYDAGIKRYGFHGLSFEFIASRLAEIDPKAASGRAIVLHLGHGASLCALRGGASVASSMGFTALDGVPMATRSGALDPGVILHLVDRHGMDARRIERLLYRESGLLGVSGVSADMRVLLADTSPGAALAIELFVYRIGREIGSLAAALGGLDALVFTAGIGENSPEIRARICATAAWLGAEIDDEANRAGREHIGAAHGRVAIWKIPTDEEQMIARHTERAIGGAR